MEEFKKRLLEFIESQYNVSQREFERMCDLAQGTVGSISRQGLTTSNLLKILNTCPNLNLNWLVAGSGEMLVSAPLQNIQGNNNHHNSNGADARYIAHLEAEIEALRKEKEELWTLIQKLTQR